MSAVLAVTIGRGKKGANLQEPINQNVKEPSFTRNGNQVGAPRCCVSGRNCLPPLPSN